MAGMATPLDRPQYRSPPPQLPGAGGATGIDAGTAWHYGDPIAEQRAAETAVALFDRSNRQVITVSGPDRLTWLHTLTSQFLNSLTDGDVTQALVLSPQGHVEHHAVVTELGEVTYLDTEPGDGAGLLGYLDGMRFWSKVEVADATSDLAVLGLTGPKTWDVIQRVLKVTDPGGGHALPLPAGGFVRHPATAVDTVELLLPRPSMGQVAATLIAAGAVPAGSWATDALRIPTRRPRWGVDVDDRTIPNEVQWLVTAVHLDKGCYRGQETVARVHNLGRPPRRLVMLHLDGSAHHLPPHGTDVEHAGLRVGPVTASARHHGPGPVALALVKRSLDPAAVLAFEGVSAAQEVVVRP